MASLFLGKTLLAQTGPTITSQPANLLGMEGGMATFNVGVTGAGPFTYQWYFNGSPAGIDGNITSVVGVGVHGVTNRVLFFPIDVTVNSAGNLFIADEGNDRVRKAGTNGVLTTVAGNMITGYSGDGGPATNAELFDPFGVAIDLSGNLFIADANNHRIRMVGTNGIITTVVGNGNFGDSGDNSMATNATLESAMRVTVNAAGDLFIADTEGNVIRKVGTNGIITTLAGNGTGGYSGDGGAATNALLHNPTGTVVDTAGNVFFADGANHRVRKIDTNGIITTVAGNGIAAYSGDGAAATNASFDCMGLTVDTAGNVFIADDFHNVIRKVGTNGIITTIAGNGASGYSGDGGAATNAELDQPSGVAVDAADNLFIADSVNNVIRKVTASNLSVTSGGATLTLSNLSSSNVGNYYVVVSNADGSVVSSVASLSLIGQWPQFIDIMPTNDSVALSFSAPASNNFIISYTTNLTPPVVWIPLATNSPGVSGNVTVIDTNTVTASCKFYRVSSP
jgi:hypothetical protein